MSTAPDRRRVLLMIGAVSVTGGASTSARAASDLTPRFESGDDPAASPVWRKVQASLFEGRPVLASAPGQLLLEAPVRAIDGAVVPVAVRARTATGADAVRKLYLVIDANPSPIAAIVQTGARSEFETRVRVDAYSHIRAIAETADGRLFQTVRFIKASGGCSAPPGADLAAARATMGRTALRIEGNPTAGSPLLAQLSVQHPNHSGMAMDQLTRQFTPAHFVRKVEASVAGRTVFSADVDFSISENPSFRFWFDPAGAREMHVHVEDSQGLRFDANHRLEAAAA